MIIDNLIAAKFKPVTNKDFIALSESEILAYSENIAKVSGANLTRPNVGSSGYELTFALTTETGKYKIGDVSVISDMVRERKKLDRKKRFKNVSSTLFTNVFGFTVRGYTVKPEQTKCKVRNIDASPLHIICPNGTVIYPTGVNSTWGCYKLILQLCGTYDGYCQRRWIAASQGDEKIPD